jgi:hypothetical protein
LPQFETNLSFDHKISPQMGYWSVGPKAFDNKWLALSEGRLTGQPVKFHFFKSAFDETDWSLPPKESLEHYMTERARQLRDQYSYVRLFYSGGVDSQTMLDVFLKNAIHIDEIICYRYCPTGNIYHLANSEINDVAIPFLQTQQWALRHTKIRIIDLMPKDYQRWLKGEWLTRKPYLDFFAPDPADIPEILPSIMDETQKFKNVCHLQGGQKPKIEKREDGYYAFYYDSNVLLDMYGEWQENFYTTPNHPELHVKQCHLLMQLLKDQWPELKAYQRVPREWADRACRQPLFISHTLGKSDDLLTTKAQLMQEDLKKHQPRLLKEFMGVLQESGVMDESWFIDNNIMSNYRPIKTEKSFFLGPLS